MAQTPSPPAAPKPKSKNMLLAIIIIVILIVVGVGVYILTRPTSPPPPTGTPVTIWDNAPGSACLNASSCGYRNGTGTTGGNNLTITHGTTVVWTNNGYDPHSVTACVSGNPSYDTTTACPAGANSSGLQNFDSNTSQSTGIPKGGTFSATFNTAGTYRYYCSFHPWMHGTIIVT